MMKIKWFKWLKKESPGSESSETENLGSQPDRKTGKIGLSEVSAVGRSGSGLKGTSGLQKTSNRHGGGLGAGKLTEERRGTGKAKGILINENPQASGLGNVSPGKLGLAEARLRSKSPGNKGPESVNSEEEAKVRADLSKDSLGKGTRSKAESKLDKNRQKVAAKLQTHHTVNRRAKQTDKIWQAKYAKSTPRLFNTERREFLKVYPGKSPDVGGLYGSRHLGHQYLYLKYDIQLGKNPEENLFSGNTLDLHGYCQEAARALLHMFFSYATQRHFKHVNIITGPGPVLKRFIAALLTAQDFAVHVKNITEESGRYIVILRY